MSSRTARWLSTIAILAVALFVWLPTIQWGLPSRDADKFLFGDRRPWTGAEIVTLTATTQPTNARRGADVDADPILDRSKPVIVNDTDAKRAAIVRRYRLMSGQPDEFIQFKALSEMAGRTGFAKLDPRLYQYGGLWMYPVGALVRTAMLVGYIPSPPAGTPAIEFYLDHPEAFGRFYVVARFYSWCWGVVAALAIAWIARRVTQSIGLATLAAVAFMLLPVTRAATHEAKPHLAGAALCLCAVVAATRYVETGKRRWLIAAGALCGAAMAVVVSMLLSCAVLPTMIWLRWRSVRRPASETRTPNIERPTSNVEWQKADSAFGVRRSMFDVRLPVDGVWSIVVPLVASLTIAVFVYVAANPFVLVNAIAHPDILRSNLGNSTAMYHASAGVFEAIRSVTRIAIDALTAPAAAVLAISTGGVVCVGVLLRTLARRADTGDVSVIAIRISDTLWPLIAPAAFVTVQFVSLASGKPAEYARFGLLPFALACVCFAFAIRIAVTLRVRSVAAIAAVAVLAPLVIAIARDARPATVERIVMPRGRVGLFYEPAPWSAPPVDLFANELILIRPEGSSVALDGLLWPGNLSSQINGAADRGDWRLNQFERRTIVR